MIAINGSQLVVDNQTNVYNNMASIGSAISACNSEVTAPSELVMTGNSTGCLFYSGNINCYNISEFIRQEFSTTPAIPTAITTPIITTNAFIPTTPFMKGSQSVGGDGTNYARIAVAISCVSLVLTVGLCGLVGVFLGIKIFFMIRKRRSSRSWSHDNQFLLQEEET